MAVLFVDPASGSEQHFGGQAQTSGSSRASQTPPPQTGRGQVVGAANPAPTQPGQRPQPTAEQMLSGWLWWKDEAVKKEMKLTDRQVQSINRVFEARVRYITPFNDELQKQLAELDRMAKERKVDEAIYAVQVSRAEALRSKLNETRYVMLYAISKQLSDEQVLQLKDIRDRHRAGRGGGGPIPRTW